MFNKQLKANIKNLDMQIANHCEELLRTEERERFEEVMQKIDDLTDIRAKLAESKVKESHKEAIISGLFGIAGVVMVLKHEKTDIVTSKAFGMATKMFRGV